MSNVKFFTSVRRVILITIRKNEKDIAERDMTVQDGVEQMQGVVHTPTTTIHYTAMTFNQVFILWAN